MPYTCKIATREEIARKFDYEISIHPEDRVNWLQWKQEFLNREEGKRIAYYGVLDGEIICEATAALTKDACANSDGLVSDTMAYLFAFRTNEPYRGQGYFSILFHYMLDDLRSRGYTRVTLGVEPKELKNKAIYAHYGFTEFIKQCKEYDPDGTAVEVEYYAMDLTGV